MDSLLSVAVPDADLQNIATFAAELASLKRIRDARSPDSLATRLFRRAWLALCAGTAARDVAMAISADALVALRLGGIDTEILASAGLNKKQTADVLQASFDDVATIVPDLVRGELRGHIAGSLAVEITAPWFVETLIRQPRAGATCPGKPRIVLEPPESHGDHCLAVAVLGVVLCAEFGADPAPVFLAGLAHHLHNATLPDSGFAGEMLLGSHLQSILRQLTGNALAALTQDARLSVERALALASDASTPEGRAFNAADVIDRIMEVKHFSAVAGFTETQALDKMQLVHEGPLQDFHHSVMRRTGLMPA